MKHHFIAVSALALGASATIAGASITVTNNTNALDLANALLGEAGGITITNATLNGHSGGGLASSGIFNVDGGNNYGLTGTGAVLSTGNASSYSSGPNTETDFTAAYGVAATAGQEALLDPITGGGFNHFDVTTLTIEFDAVAPDLGINFNVVFGSDEYEEFVGTEFIDGFGIFLNGTNLAFSEGLPININHPSFAAVNETELDGVILNSVGNPNLSFGASSVLATGNQLTFIISDTSDANYDSTVYIQGLAVPAPATIGLFGLFGLAARRRRQG